MSQDFLSTETLSRLRPSVAKPDYDRGAIRPGIVHLGPGAFHRAHQTPAFDAILADDPRWGIVGVSLHSTDVRDALKPQSGLYTLALLDEEISYRIIGSVLDVLVAPENPEAVLAKLAAPETEIVTLTITEKGYCLDANGVLNFDHPDIRHDIASPAAPKSGPGYLVEGLRRRHAANIAPFAVISCDNLSGNGRKLAAALQGLARAQQSSATFLSWLASEVACPSTMVDSITPATTDALRDQVADAIGVRDRWPIQREAFTQWVLERDPRLPKLDWAGAGVTVTDDVSAFERAKLRVLNSSHSSLAYMGLARGHETVFEAISDPELARFVRAFMTLDVAPTLKPSEGLDLAAYIEAVQKRFRNPAIRHLLSQIAWDGSQKLPNRLFGLIEEAIAAGRPIERPARIVAAWLRFLRRKAVTGEQLVDPLAPILLETAARAHDDAEHDPPLFLSLDAVFPRSLAENETFRAALKAAYAQAVSAP